MKRNGVESTVQICLDCLDRPGPGWTPTWLISSASAAPVEPPEKVIPPPQLDTPTDDAEWLFEERAAIAEFDGGLTRYEAELIARREAEERDHP
jgi:hypothetical protein